MKSRTPLRRRAEASRQESEYLKKLRSASTPLRARYVADLRFHRFSEVTEKKYLDAMLRLAAYFHRSPDTLSDEQLREYFDHLENRRHYSNSTLGIAHAALTFFYAHTCPRDMPFLRIFRHRRDKTLPVVLSREEVRAALARVKDVRYHACLALIYSCGLRVGEAVNVEVGDIDAAQGLVYIRDGKGGKPRAVPLPGRTLRILRDMWKTHRHPRLLFPAYRVERKPVYRKHGSQDHPFSIGAPWSHFKKALAASGCRKNATVHSLRHSYATHLLEEGVALFTVKEHLGHSCVSTTMRYTHMTQKLRRDGAGTIEDLMADL